MKIYRKSPALEKAEKKYADYMRMVREKTAPEYKAWIDEGTKEAKKAYADALRKLTVESKEYSQLLESVMRVLSDTNQKALDVMNANTSEIYAVNYNQVAVDCKKAGIEVRA